MKKLIYKNGGNIMKKSILEERIKPLVENDKVKVYVDIGPTWLDPVLYMELDGKLVKMTVSSGEYEADLGEFFLYKGPHLEKAIEVMNEISDSVVELGVAKITTFKLKKEYLDKLKKINDEAPVYI